MKFVNDLNNNEFHFKELNRWWNNILWANPFQHTQQMWLENVTNDRFGFFELCTITSSTMLLCVVRYIRNTHFFPKNFAFIYIIHKLHHISYGQFLKNWKFSNFFGKNVKESIFGAKKNIFVGKSYYRDPDFGIFSCKIVIFEASDRLIWHKLKLVSEFQSDRMLDLVWNASRHKFFFKKCFFCTFLCSVHKTTKL